MCRSKQGVFLGASAIVFNNIDDPATLEALAIREGLALAEDLNLNQIQLASDCEGVVRDVRCGTAADFGAIIKEIQLNSMSFISCNIAYESRSSNIEAHNLAKHSLSLAVGRHVWLG